MSLLDKLKARRRKKRKTGKRMRHFKENGAWSRWKRARARHKAQIAAIEKIQAAIKEQGGWPDTMVIEELFNNDNGYHNHLHVASQERDKLIQIAKIAQAHYSGGDPDCVREFSPFDPVDPVHAPNSWHYRDLAFDLRSTPRQAFGDELKRRYYVKECDF